MLSTSLQKNDYNCSVVAKIGRDYNAVRRQISEKLASLFIKLRFLIPKFFRLTSIYHHAAVHGHVRRHRALASEHRIAVAENRPFLELF